MKKNITVVGIIAGMAMLAAILMLSPWHGAGETLRVERVASTSAEDAFGIGYVLARSGQRFVNTITEGPNELTIDLSGNILFPPGDTFPDPAWEPSYLVNVVNGTVASQPGENKLFTLTDVAFAALETAVGEDQKLPLHVRALSASGADAEFTGLSFGVSAPSMGAVIPRDEGDPEDVAAWFVPEPGAIGEIIIAATARNKRDEVINGNMTVQIVAGTALNLELSAGDPVDQ